VRSISPLRYPGGKACLYNLFLSILRDNDLLQRLYIEPYSGGCGLGLTLLLNGHMSRLHINDVDRSIWAFWNLLLNNSASLVEKILSIPITIEEWQRQREVQQYKDTVDADTLGFSTFFLNRTNRSGVIHGGGVIGGLDQTGKYKIDCRFNRLELISRVERIVKYRGRIKLSNLDAEILIQESPAESVFYIDPPYFEKGSSLYMNAYNPNDHKRLAQTLNNELRPWILTYDDVCGIRDLYNGRLTHKIEVPYSVQTKRKGAELMIFQPALRAPKHLVPLLV